MMDMSKNLVLYGLDPSHAEQYKELEKIITGLEDVTMVLLEDAVIGSVRSLQKDRFASLLTNKIGILALREDVEARGIRSSDIKTGISLIGYSELVDQIAIAEKLISWL